MLPNQDGGTHQIFVNPAKIFDYQTPPCLSTTIAFKMLMIVGPHLRTFSRRLTLSPSPSAPAFDHSTVTADDPLPLQLSSSEDPTKTSMLRQDPLLELVDPQDPLLELVEPQDPLLELLDPDSTWTCCCVKPEMQEWVDYYFES